ncbi:MAG: ABC transporter ATP-binding protein [Pirellulales bacterium]
MLRAVTLAVSPGQIHSLLGPSGSGKTTLLRLIAGLEVLAEGRILIAEQEVATCSSHVPPESRAIGFVFQDYALFPHLDVRDNVLFGMPDKPRRERLARLRELLDKVRMSDFALAMPHTLSGGEQQRVALARAMAREPVVMLLDEPFSGLDVRLRDEIRELTVKVLRAAAVATLLVTHDPQEALLVSDLVSVIRDGRVEQTGTPQEVYFQPRTLHVAETFGRANRLVRTVQRGAVNTPWGVIATPSCKEDERVCILLRPESVTLHEKPMSNSVSAIIRRSRMRGQASSVEVELPDGETMIAFVSSYRNWASGAVVHISLAPNSAIVLSDQHHQCVTENGERPV